MKKNKDMIFSSQFLLVLILNFLIQLANSQSQLGKIIETQKFVKPIDCNRQTEYYDTARLKCLPCPENSAPSDRNFHFSFLIFYKIFLNFFFKFS